MFRGGAGGIQQPVRGEPCQVRNRRQVLLDPLRLVDVANHIDLVSLGTLTMTLSEHDRKDFPIRVPKTRKLKQFQSVCYEVKVIFDNLRIWYEFIVPRNGVIKGEGFANRKPLPKDWTDADWGENPIRRRARLEQVSAHFADTGRLESAESVMATPASSMAPAKPSTSQNSRLRSGRHVTTQLARGKSKNLSGRHNTDAPRTSERLRSRQPSWMADPTFSPYIDDTDSNSSLGARRRARDGDSTTT